MTTARPAGWLQRHAVALGLMGLMGWEGHTLLFDHEEKAAKIRECIGALVETAELCRAAGLPVEIVSCSGSGTFLESGAVSGITEASPSATHTRSQSSGRVRGMAASAASSAGRVPASRMRRGLATIMASPAPAAADCDQRPVASTEVIVQ